MKILEILSEEYTRELKNPLGFNRSNIGDAFEYMDDIDERLIALYKKEQNITSGLRGAELMAAGKKQNEKYGTVINVPISGIIPTEEYLVQKQIDNINNGTAKTSSRLPIVYKLGDKYVIGDGNHRIAAAFLRGEQTIKSLVLDGTKIKKIRY